MSMSHSWESFLRCTNFQFPIFSLLLCNGDSENVWEMKVIWSCLAIQSYFIVSFLKLSFVSTSAKLDQMWDGSDEMFKEAVFTDETLFSRKFAKQL